MPKPVLDGLVERAAQLASGGRAILGIVGCPGAGKSTLAERIATSLDPAGVWVTRVPMDGFHLADAALERLQRRHRKGAIETFDGFGYLAALRRIRAEVDHVVYVPDFHRELEQPIAGSIAVGPAVRLVITEGNYLLERGTPWSYVHGELDETWYVDLDDSVRRERLVARHIRFGKTPQAANRWFETVDEPNARRIVATRQRADLVVDMAQVEPATPIDSAPTTNRHGAFA